MPTDLEKLASGLSEAQRRALLMIPERFAEVSAFLPTYMRRQSISGLATAHPQLVQRLISRKAEYRLTPLGLSLRTHLLTQEKDNG